MDYHSVLERLRNAPKGELAAIKKQTGLPYQTLRNIRNGKTEGPRLTTIDKIASFYKNRAA